MERNNPNKAYRIRGVPCRYDSAQLERVLRSLFHMNASQGISIRCLTSDCSNTTPKTLTAIFNLQGDCLPAELAEPQHRWEYPAFEGSEVNEMLVIDDDFRGFTVLYEPCAESHSFDLIAIPGLGGGHAWGSFKIHNGSHMWLLDDLPKDWPTARILVYGYDTRLRNRQSKQDLEMLAQQFTQRLRSVRRSRNNPNSEHHLPIIYLAHSLGGLLLKQALIHMSMAADPMDRSNFFSTLAILFFGVPNQGLNISDLGLAAMVKDQPMKEFLHDLRKNSPLLANLSHDFCTVFNFRDSTTFSLFETEKSPTAELKNGEWAMTGPPEMFVDMYSAFNGRSWELDTAHVIPVSADHSGLVRFTALDEKYIATLKILKSLDSIEAIKIIRKRLNICPSFFFDCTTI